MAKQIVGIDIGEKSVRLALMAGNAIKKAVSAELPDDMVSDGRILSMDAMADFIRELAKENGIPKGNAAIILPSSLVYVRNITIPAMTEQQLRYNLPFEFRDYLAEEKGKYVFDYAVLDTRFQEDGTPVEMDILACAALRQTVDDYRAMLRRAGFRLKIMVPDEYALSSVLYGKYGKSAREDEKCVCVVNLGYKATDLFFYHGSDYSLRRIIDFGLYDLERRVAELKNVDEHMAHTYVAADYEGILSHPDCMEIYDNLAVEIMKAINFFNYNNRSMELRDLYVAGSTSVGHFREAIAGMTKLELLSVHELLRGSAIEKPWMYLFAYGCALEEKGGRA